MDTLGRETALPISLEHHHYRFLVLLPLEASEKMGDAYDVRCDINGNKIGVVSNFLLQKTNMTGALP